MNREKKLLIEIQAGKQKAIETVYNRYKTEFIIFASRFSIYEEDALDIYQDSIIILYENIVSGKLSTLTSSLKTYLFAIGKYKIYNVLKLKINTTDYAEYEFQLEEETEDDFGLQEENIVKIQIAYQELGEKCQQVLKLFYFENRDIEEIKNKLNYASKDVVKSQKSRCIKHLKTILLKKN